MIGSRAVTSPTPESESEKAPIAVALDAPDLDSLRTWSSAVAPVVSCLKVGLEAFCRDGHVSVVQARLGATEAGNPDIDIFLDLKLHDIPATVRGAARAVAPLEPTYLTVHAAGGPAMIEAAATALPATRIAAVTVLTSLDAQNVVELGIQGDPQEIVERWARMAVDSGAGAIVCSPKEVASLRGALPNDVMLITPGVRPSGADAHDQRRSASPRQALHDGADLLVVGRPITQQQDLRAAARGIAQECGR